MVVLIHTSKTMRSQPPPTRPTTVPALLDRAVELHAYLRTLTPRRLATVMELSTTLAERVHEQLAAWSADPEHQWPAVESFLGDIYSGLQVSSFSTADRTYAGRHLRILSGLYGILRPYDGISPYRLEMGYRLPDKKYSNLYRFWGSTVADQLPATGPIVNLAATEYSKVVLDQVDPARVITPRFLTVNPKTGAPGFVAVHAKIARGAFARWLIVGRVKATLSSNARAAGPGELADFAELGYRYDPSASSSREPCFVCEDFEGKGMSIRLN
jgi:cytoplasmic iron level regulating protein YaaA (DUF328/UPF0246 family)